MDDYNNQHPYNSANTPVASAGQTPVYQPSNPANGQVQYQAPVQSQPITSTHQQMPGQMAQGAPQTAKKNKTPLIIGGIVVAVIAIVVAIVIAITSSGKGGKKDEKEKGNDGASSYESALEMYFDAIYKGETSNIENLLPKEIWEYYLDEEGALSDEFDSTKELIAAVEENYTDWYEEWVDDSDYGAFDKYDYEIEAKDVSDSKLEKIAESLSDIYDIDEGSVEKAYKLTLDGEIVFEDDEYEVDDREFYSVKISGKWYIVAGSEDYYFFVASEFVWFALED